MRARQSPPAAPNARAEVDATDVDENKMARDCDDANARDAANTRDAANRMAIK